MYLVEYQKSMVQNLDDELIAALPLSPPILYSFDPKVFEV